MRWQDGKERRGKGKGRGDTVVRRRRVEEGERKTSN